MKQQLIIFPKALLGSCKDLLPIVLVIAFFQCAVLQQPMPNLSDTFVGLILVKLGLTFFIYGLEMGLFPIGESMTKAFAQKGSTTWLLIFTFCLGLGTTVAEPALIAVASEAATVAASAGIIGATDIAQNEYANGLRY